MAVDFSILARVPTIGSQIMAGQEAGREAAARNMLLQQRQLEFQQAQEDRRLAMEERRMQREAVAAQVARRGQLAQVLRQSGMDPSDMQSATQFYAAALEANEPTAIAAAKDWLSLARETAQSRAAGAEYQGIMGGGAPAPAPMATPMAAAPAPMAPAPMAAPEPPPFGARETYGAGEVSPGGAVSFAVAPPPAPMPPPVNQLAPQAPAAPPVNQLAAAPAPAAAPTPAPAKDDAAALRAEAQRLEAQQQRLRQSGFKANQERAKDLDKPIERLLKRADDIEKADADKPPLIVGGRLVSRTGQIIYEPPPGPIKPSERYVPVGQNVFDRVEGKFIEGPARAAVRAETEARVKPAAPIRVRPGEVVISPETGQTIFTAPPAPARAPAGRAAAAAAGAPAAAAGTPAQQAKAEAQQAAQTNLSRDLQTQLGYYEELAKMGAMSSPGRPVVANVLAYARSSGLGQEAERAAGTKAQTLRDNIANARQRILMHVKNATGATAGQMNSNIELQTWLRSLTDPQQSIETVRETLKQMDAVIGSVRNQVAQEGTRRAPAAAPAVAPAPAPAAANRREIAPGVFVTERP